MPASLQLDQDHKNKLAEHLSSILHIRAYCIGLEQTFLNPISDPPPDWYPGLNTNLNAAKTHAQVWTQTIEPGITSVIPQAIISFGTRFQVATADILDILKTSGYHPSADQRTAIADHLHWSMRHLGDQKTTIEDLRGKFIVFQTNAGADLGTLTSGASSIQHAIDVDNGIIIKLNGDILAAQADIAADKAAITASAVAGGVGLFVGVGLIGLGAAAGPAAPFVMGIGALIMVGSIVEMAVVISKYAKKLAAAQARLNDDQANLRLEQQQVASLTVLKNSIGNLVNLNKDMAQSLSNISNWWGDVKTKLNTVIQDVQDATDDTAAQHWHDLEDDIKAAQKDWADYAKFATNLQDITSGATVQQINVRPQAQAA